MTVDDHQSFVESFSQLSTDNPLRSNLLQCYLLFEGSIIYCTEETLPRKTLEMVELKTFAGNVFCWDLKRAVMLKILV